MAYKKIPSFTHIELLIGILLMSSVVIVTGYLLISHFRLFSNEKALIDIGSYNKLTLDEMTNQIREGNAVVTTCSACGGDTTSSTVLVLRIYPLNANNEPFEPTGGQDYDYIVYKRDTTDNTKLLKKTFADASSHRTTSIKTSSVNVSSLVFSYDNADPTQANQITVTLENTITVAKKTQKINQEIKAVLRNK